MMKKLIKYEMRSMLRLFLPLWPSLILLSIINHFTLRADFYSDTVASRILEALVMILMFLYVVLIMAIGIVALIVMIRRFYVGLLRDEGYLMFTLPVKTSQIIWSKLISAVILTAITGIVCMISVFIMALDKEVIKELFTMLQTAQQQVGNISWLLVQFLIAGVLTSLISAVSAILMAYCSMAIGQTVNKHKLGMSIVIYIVISTALSTVFSFFTTVVMFAAGTGDRLVNWIDQLFANGFTVAGASTFLWAVSGIAILIGAVQIAVFYFLTHFMLKNKLNLE